MIKLFYKYSELKSYKVITVYDFTNDGYIRKGMKNEK